MKKKGTPIELQPLGGVYRVPIKKVYKSKRLDKEMSWDDVYGKHKCITCKKHFKEGDAYVVVIEWKKHSDGSESPLHKYQHVRCE